MNTSKDWVVWCNSKNKGEEDHHFELHSFHVISRARIHRDSSYIDPQLRVLNYFLVKVIKAIIIKRKILSKIPKNLQNTPKIPEIPKYLQNTPKRNTAPPPKYTWSHFFG